MNKGRKIELRSKMRGIRTLHGLSNLPVYKVRSYIIARCEDKKNKDYKYYGAK